MSQILFKSFHRNVFKSIAHRFFHVFSKPLIRTECSFKY